MYVSRACDDPLTAGATVLGSTFLGGVIGMFGGYASWNRQIGSVDYCSTMTNSDRGKQRNSFWEAYVGDSEDRKKYVIHHPYGCYGNNRNYVQLVSKEEHKLIHKILGYKVSGGQFVQPYPHFVNIWRWILQWL